MPDNCYLTGFAVFLMMSLIYFLFYKKLKNSYRQDVEKRVTESENSAQMKELFLANISHETRTPLNVIIGLTHLLQKTQLDDTQKKHLDTIAHSSNLLLSITNEILDFSKIEAGKMKINKSEFDLNDVLKDVAELISVAAKDKGLELVFNVAPDINAALIGDSLRMTQVLINLLNNAVKFTEKGSVTLKITKVSDEGVQTLRFEVIDTGIGMTNEQTSNIFEAFTQADSRISRNFGGTGLGLAISNELVTMMDGELDVESTLYHGSTFGVTLGFETQSKKDDKQYKYTSRLLAGKQILIIDESESATVMADLLAYFSVKPVISTKRNEIDKLLNFNRFDVVIVSESYILDTDLMASIRRQSDHVVVMGYDVHTQKYGYVKTLFKPFTPLKVLSLISRLFDKSVVKSALKEERFTFDDILVLGGSKILLAEDNEGNRMVVQGLLQDSGITIVEAENGQKAVEAMLKTSEPYDLILMDINMPVMDGYVSTSIIREYQKFDHTPIVALTANITQSQVDKAKSYGMQGYLNKPIDTELFYKMLLQYIHPKKETETISPVREKESVADQAVPELPGVDTQTGLARLNGNQKIYNEILLKFADIFTDAIKTLQSILETENYKEAADYAHNMKGLAGNIGADSIYELAKDLDAACKDESQSAMTIVRELDMQLTPLLDAIKMHAHKHEKQKVKEAVISASVLAQYLLQLNEAASRQKARDAKKVCEALLEYAWPSDKQKILSEIIKASKEYDFEKVQNLIEYTNKLKSE